MRITVDHIVHIAGADDLCEIKSTLASLLMLGERIMPTVAQLQEAIVTLGTDIAAEKAEVDAKLAAILTEVEALKAVIAAGTATEAALDPLLASLTALRTDVQNITVPAPIA